MLTVAIATAGISAAFAADPRTVPGHTNAGRPGAATPSIQIRVVDRGGFHWSDAAAGSLAAFGLTLVVAGVTAARRRQ